VNLATSAPTSALGTRSSPGEASGALWGFAVAGVIALGALNFLWQLGSSSYFVDEVLSIQHALPGFGAINHLVATTETTPWTYFWALHVWLNLTGSQSEWVLRLPEALACVALIGAVYWMARAFAGRWTALLAALLTALSPLVLTYAQRVRVYPFALLALTLCVGLIVRAVREERHRTGRLLAGAALAILALWLHYTASLVVAPLCVWLAVQRGVSTRARAAFISSCAVGGVALLPLFLRQYSYAPNGGVGAGGGITALNVVRILETPFDGRYVASVNAFRIIALIVVAVSSLVLLLRARADVRQPRLLVALALTAPLAILIGGLAGKDVVITRYTVVAAPMLVTTVAAGITSLPRIPATVLAALAAIAALWGLARVHERSGFYPPAREALEFIQAHRVPGDVIAVPGHPGADVPMAFYAPRVLHPLAPFVEGTDHTAVTSVLHQHRPLWYTTEYRTITSSPAAIRRFFDRAFAPYGYRATTVGVISTSSTFLVMLLTPPARHAGRGSG
jgi:hypothetical protein